MIRAALDAYAGALQREFAADRSQTVGASEVGQCERKVFYAKNSGDPVCGARIDIDYEDSWGARLRGSVFEDRLWVPAMRARFGSKLLFAGDEQKTLVSGFLSATPDGLIVEQPRDVIAHLGVSDIGGNALLIECKTADPRTKLDAPKPEHRFQVIVQLGLVRELTAYRPNYGVISYTDASFWDEGIEFAIAFDAKVFAVAKERARRIMTATSAAELKPEGWISGGKECEYCAFAHACGRARGDMPKPAKEPPDPQFVAEIADLGREARRLEVEAEAAAARLRELQHDIKGRLREKGFRRIAGDGVTVTWSPVKGRAAFDMKGIREAAAAAGIDLTKYETVGNPTDQLVITQASA